MFTSAQYLQHQLGIHPPIAAYFVDRDPPPDNRYWKGRQLYVARGTGYLFIPVVYDLLYRMGVEEGLLLEEGRVARMEAILDSAARVEFDGLPPDRHIAYCMETAKPWVSNAWLWGQLVDYFASGAPAPNGLLGSALPPLNRADSFLFSVCDLDLDVARSTTFLRYWYALISAFLLMDDVMDWHADQQQGEENTLRFLGQGRDAFAAAISLLEAQFRTLGEINPHLAAHFGESLQKKMQSGSLEKRWESPEAGPGPRPEIGDQSLIKPDGT